MSPLSRRLAKLELRRPAQGPAQLVDANLLDPEVLALWLEVDISHMNLSQLDLLEDNLRKLAWPAANADGRFGAGNSGKPRGTRHKATQAVLGLRLCLERLAPVRKDNPVVFPLPRMIAARDAAQAAGAMLEAVSEGDLTPTEGAQIMGLVDAYRRTLETSELEARVAALEGQHG